MKNFGDRMAPSPQIRGWATLLAIVAAFFCQNPSVMTIALVCLILPLTIITGVFIKFAKFVSVVIFPIALGLLFVWGWLMGAPPGEPRGSSPSAGCLYGAIIFLRLALVSGVVFVSLLSMRADRMVTVFRSWGIRGELLTLLIISFALWPEFALRTEQIYAARCARGLMPNRNPLTRAKQFPFILRTLFTWAIGNALTRLDLWRQQDLLTLLERRTTTSAAAHTLLGDLCFGLLSVAWLITIIYTRVQ
jgi:energy-coupling factor transporter transmembrane protein EcfT